MLKNHLKIAFRQLKKQRLYSAVNIIGLTFGFLCFLVLNAYVSSEKSYDIQHGNAYRLLQKKTDDNGAIREIAPVGPQVGYSSKEQFPEIDAVTEMIGMGRRTVGNEPGNRNYERISAIDNGFFKVFNFKFLEGNAENLFSQANGILLTQSIKEKYFGNGNAIGKSLKINDFDGIVAGVMEDFPSNTHLNGGLILPEQTAEFFAQGLKEFKNSNWDRNAFLTYFKLKKDVNIPSLENKITRLVKENWPQDQSFNSQFALQSVKDIHLYDTEVEGEINSSKGNLFYINIFFWIAIVILLVACFNYTGLLNVSFMGRSREIGLRKVLGAGQKQLFWQFLVESLLLTSFSMLLAWSVLQFAKPYIPEWFGADFNLSGIPFYKMLWIVFFGLVISLLSIGYPTYLISKLAVVSALKEEHKGKQKIPFRKVMTVFQFVVAIALIACTSILYRQVNYLQEKELGFGLGGLVTVDINSRILRNQFEAVKTEFSKLPEVQSVSVSSRIPGEWKQFPLADVMKQGQQNDQAEEMIFIAADQDFLNTFEVELLKGNNFTGKPSDSTKVLLNQSAVEALGLEEAIGQWVEIPQVNFSGDINVLEQPLRVQIAGVVEDFHFEDFRKTIKPMAIGFWRNPIHSIDYYTLRVSTEDWGNTIATLGRINDGFDPNNPLEFNILNDRFQRFYEADILRSHLLFFFAGVVIFIACLGLLAMTAFTLKNRIKEIGIRKVLGASTLQIVGLIGSDFLKIVLISAIIAIPISWLLMDRWLAEFAYQLPMEWWVFAAAGIGVLAATFITISLQSVKAALTSPVDSLKSE